MNVFASLIFYVFIIVSYRVDAISDQELSENKDTIIWLVEEKKENVDLLAKKSPSTSTASYIESLVISQLENFNVEINRVSMKNINFYMKTKSNVCVANRANLPERREYSIFSTPQSFYLTHRLYRYDQRQPLPKSLLNSDNEIISLKAVFSTLSRDILGLAENVSYGNFLDGEIKKLDQQDIFYRNGVNRVVALEAMLYANKVDALLALPVDIVPTAAQKEKLEQYAIAGAPPYLIAHFSCANSELGNKVINDINVILAKMYKSEDYYLAHKKWFTEDDLVKLQAYLKANFSTAIYITPN